LGHWEPKALGPPKLDNKLWRLRAFGYWSSKVEAWCWCFTKIMQVGCSTSHKVTFIGEFVEQCQGLQPFVDFHLGIKARAWALAWGVWTNWWLHYYCKLNSPFFPSSIWKFLEPNPFETFVKCISP
jgi:hypothetical protein